VVFSYIFEVQKDTSRWCCSDRDDENVLFWTILSCSAYSSNIGRSRAPCTREVHGGLLSVKPLVVGFSRVAKPWNAQVQGLFPIQPKNEVSN